MKTHLTALLVATRVRKKMRDRYFKYSDSYRAPFIQGKIVKAFLSFSFTLDSILNDQRFKGINISNSIIATNKRIKRYNRVTTKYRTVFFFFVTPIKVTWPDHWVGNCDTDSKDRDMKEKSFYKAYWTFLNIAF